MKTKTNGGVGIAIIRESNEMKDLNKLAKRMNNYNKLWNKLFKDCYFIYWEPKHIKEKVQGVLNDGCYWLESGGYRFVKFRNVIVISHKKQWFPFILDIIKIKEVMKE